MLLTTNALPNGLPHLFSVPQCNLSLGCKTADEIVNDLDPNENLPAALSGEVVGVENDIAEGRDMECTHSPSTDGTETERIL